MRIFIVAQTELPVNRSMLIAKVKDLLQICVQSKDTQVILVGENLAADLVEFCNKLGSVSIQSTESSSKLINQITNAIVIHFGVSLKWAKGFPHYFLPLLLPNTIHELGFIKGYLLKRKYKFWLESASKIVSTNDWSAQALQMAYPAYRAKFHSLHLPTLTMPSFEWTTLSATKQSITDGNNYFLVFAPIERVTAILKEFSIFKKWQQTTMHLVFIVATKKQVEAAIQILKGYKFRHAISVYTADELCMEWMAATYAILWEGVDFSKAAWIENAIQYEIPLLFDNTINLPETWLKAGEVFSFTEKLALSNHFKLYYKDEVYRQARARMGTDWLKFKHEKKSDQFFI